MAVSPYALCLIFNAATRLWTNTDHIEYSLQCVCLCKNMQPPFQACTLMHSQVTIWTRDHNFAYQRCYVWFSTNYITPVYTGLIIRNHRSSKIYRMIDWCWSFIWFLSCSHIAWFAISLHQRIVSMKYTLHHQIILPISRMILPALVVGSKLTGYDGDRNPVFLCILCIH